MGRRRRRAVDGAGDGVGLRVYRPGIFLTTMLYIPRTLSRGYDFLASAPGFKTVVAPVLATYAIALGVETIYLSLPVFSGEIGLTEELKEGELRDRRFVPKLGINDGAELHRLLPIRQTQNLAAQVVGVPGIVQRALPQQKRNVWDNPALLVFSFILCAAIQHYERKIMKPRALKELKQDFASFNNQKRVTADPDAVFLAQKMATQVNMYGTGRTAIDAACTFFVYAFEFAAFFASFGGNASFWLELFYSMYTVFGYETFNPMEEDSVTPAIATPVPAPPTKVG